MRAQAPGTQCDTEIPEYGPLVDIQGNKRVKYTPDPRVLNAHCTPSSIVHSECSTSSNQQAVTFRTWRERSIRQNRASQAASITQAKPMPRHRGRHNHEQKYQPGTPKIEERRTNSMPTTQKSNIAIRDPLQGLYSQVAYKDGPECGQPGAQAHVAPILSRLARGCS